MYNGLFEPIPSKEEPRWPTHINFPKMIHDKDIKMKKGRKKFTKFKNAINFQVPIEKKEMSSLI